MTAAELIAALSSLPPDTPIYTWNGEWSLLTPAVLTSDVADVDLKPNNHGQLDATRAYGDGPSALWRDAADLKQEQMERRTVHIIGE